MNQGAIQKHINIAVIRELGPLLPELLGPICGSGISNVYVEERTVDVHVRRLRKALASAGADEYIQTVRGAGYRFSTRG